MARSLRPTRLFAKFLRRPEVREALEAIPGKFEIWLATPSGPTSEHAIVVDGETVGWTSGDAAVTAAALLPLLIKAELQKWSFGAETLHRYKELAALHSLSEQFARCQDETTVAELAVSTCVQTLSASSGRVLLVRRGCLMHAAGTGVAIDDHTTDRVLTSGQAENFEGIGFMSAPFLVFDPVLGEQALQGVIELTRPEPWETGDLRLLTSMARQLGAAIETARLLEERKTAEDRLRAMNADLVAARDEALAASQAKSIFLANMSHELRTPLNAILGYTELVQEEAIAENRTQTAADLDMVIQQSRHLLRIVGDLLDLSRIEAGSMQLRRAPCDVGALAGGVIGVCESLAARRRNALRLHVIDLPVLPLDETRLRQILLNLVSNACKFTQGGTVTLSVDCLDDVLMFEVRDTGIGISAEQQASLFHVFWQADSSSTKSYAGAGLGLAISKQLAELMDGHIEVESQLGKGSIFRLRLPIIEDSPTPTGGPRRTDPQAIQRS